MIDTTTEQNGFAPARKFVVERGPRGSRIGHCAFRYRSLPLSLTILFRSKLAFNVMLPAFTENSADFS